MTHNAIWGDDWGSVRECYTIDLDIAHPRTEDGARAAVSGIADEAHTETAVTLLEQRAFLRISAQVSNRPDEYERLAHALPGIISA